MTIDLKENHISSCPYVSITPVPISPWGSVPSFLVSSCHNSSRQTLCRSLCPLMCTLSHLLHEAFLVCCPLEEPTITLVFHQSLWTLVCTSLPLRLLPPPPWRWGLGLSSSFHQIPLFWALHSNVWVNDSVNAPSQRRLVSFSNPSQVSVCWDQRRSEEVKDIGMILGPMSLKKMPLRPLCKLPSASPIWDLLEIMGFPSPEALPIFTAWESESWREPCRASQPTSLSGWKKLRLRNGKWLPSACSLRK